MLRRVGAWVATIAVGVLLGLGSAWIALEYGRSTFSSHYGDWTHSRAAGSSAAGPYTRAVIAREGLLALSAREALYFNLARDSEGRPLDEGCVYELTGGAFEARWWFLPALSMIDCVVLGVLLTMAGLWGDLAESAMKRSVGAKDSGGVLPGHGGMLDRLDSLLFTAPAFFYYVTLMTRSENLA